jgi:hypothetical protein
MPYDILTIEGEEIQSVLEVGSPGLPGTQGPARYTWPSRCYPVR